MRFGLREFIFLLVLVAVPLGAFLYVFKPRTDAISKAQQEINVKQAKLDLLKDIRGRIDDIGLAIEMGQEHLEQIESKLPSRQDVESILEQVWQRAEANEQIVTSVKSEKPIQTAQYMELPLTVNMEGEFDGFYQFLLDLESLPRITRIRQLELKRSGGTSGRGAEDVPEGWMKAKFTLTIFYEA